MSDTAISNSYIESDTELETMIGGDQRTAAIALKALDAASQVWYCQEATRRIDALTLRGQRYEGKYIENGSQKDTDEDGLAQVLEFPRIIDGIVVEWDYGTDLPIVPDLVKRACMEEAIAIYAFDSDSDRTDRATMKADGVKSYNLGGVYSENLDVSLSEKHCGLLSDVAWRFMRRYVGAGIR